MGRVWKNKEGRHFFVEWNVNISLLSDCVNAYLHDDNSDIVATDTMKNTVHFSSLLHFLYYPFGFFFFLKKKKTCFCCCKKALTGFVALCLVTFEVGEIVLLGSIA